MLDRYDDLFGQGQTEGSTTSAQSGFANKWGWYQSLFALSQGDITRIEEVTKLNVNFCFTMLAFIKEKESIEGKEIKNKF